MVGMCVRVHACVRVSVLETKLRSKRSTHSSPELHLQPTSSFLPLLMNIGGDGAREMAAANTTVGRLTTTCNASSRGFQCLWPS